MREVTLERIDCPYMDVILDDERCSNYDYIYSLYDYCNYLFKIRIKNETETILSSLLYAW